MDRWMGAQAALRVMEIKSEAAHARRVHGLLRARKDEAAALRASERRPITPSTVTVRSLVQ